MNITIIGPCHCGKAGIARSARGTDLCYRHAKGAMREGARITWASRKDAERAVKALGGTVVEREGTDASS